MAARVIPFQPRKQESPQTGSMHSDAALQPRGSSAHGLQLVRSGAPIAPTACPTSQQQALRIVAEVSEVQRRRGPVSAGADLNERSPQFWATLPLPKPAMETPLTVARRLVHMLLAHPRSA